MRPGEPVSIGWPLDGWEAAVSTKTAIRLFRRAGRAVIAGVGVARYLTRCSTPNGSAVPRWDGSGRTATGDIVRETDEGLAFVGRRDHQVKIGGRRIELGEIDARLSELLGSGRRDRRAGDRCRHELLVAYVVGEVEAVEVRAMLAERLPQALVPMIVVLDELPQAAVGKSTGARCPGPRRRAVRLGARTRWAGPRVARRALGRAARTGRGRADSDFFELGGSSLAAAKLTSSLRERFPAVAVADIYNTRSGLGQLSARLDQIGVGIGRARRARRAPALGCGPARRRVPVLALAAPPWLLGLLAFDHRYPGQLGPRVAWGWLIAGWVVFVSAPGRALIVFAVRRLLLGD